MPGVALDWCHGRNSARASPRRGHGRIVATTRSGPRTAAGTGDHRGDDPGQRPWAPAGWRDRDALAAHARASIVVPRGHITPSLALLEKEAPADRYTLEAGTLLRLVEVYDADEDPLAAGLVTYLEHFEGWDSWRFAVGDGPSAGILVDLPSVLGPDSRFPRETQRAALAVRRVP